MAHDLPQEFISAYKTHAFERALSISKKVHIKYVRDAFYWGCGESKIEFITALNKAFPQLVDDVAIFLAMAKIENLCIIDWFYATASRFTFNFYFVKLCELGCLSVVKHIKNENMPQRVFNFTEGFFVAAHNDHAAVCKYLMSYIPTGYATDIVIQAFRIAAQRDAVSVLEYLTTITNCSFDINDILVCTIQNQCESAAQFILQHWPNTINYHAQNGLVFKTLCNYDYYRIVSLLIYDDPTLLRYVDFAFLRTLCEHYANNTLIYILQIKSLHFRNDEGMSMITRLIARAISCGNGILLEKLVHDYPTTRIVINTTILQRVIRDNSHHVLEIICACSAKLSERLLRENPRGNLASNFDALQYAVSCDSVECFDFIARKLRVDKDINRMRKYHADTLPNSDMRKFIGDKLA